jgi:hypothetical protein
MTIDPDFYFRLKPDGAVMFRVDAQNRMRRLELLRIGAIHLDSGRFILHRPEPLTPEEEAAKDAWIVQRRAELAGERPESVKIIESLNSATQWVEWFADDAELERSTEDILLALHDLRVALVNKKIKRVRAADPGPS